MFTGGAKPKDKAKVDYNALPVPKGYVAGLGRGVGGFVTRSDIGPGMYQATAEKASGQCLLRCVPPLSSVLGAQRRRAARAAAMRRRPPSSRDSSSSMSSWAPMRVSLPTRESTRRTIGRPTRSGTRSTTTWTRGGGTAGKPGSRRRWKSTGTMPQRPAGSAGSGSDLSDGPRPRNSPPSYFFLRTGRRIRRSRSSLRTSSASWPM